MDAAPTILRLNNGVPMPALGLGVFLATPEQTADAVASALAAGYRLIDTAAAYGNEAQVGEGIRRSGIPRAQIFVTTKLWMTQYDRPERGFEASLRRLGLDYLDLYLLHWPVPTAFDTTIAAYAGLERLLAAGRTRAIGVCNFTPRHLDALAARAAVTPAVNQVELHPFFGQRELRDYDQRRGIVTQAWAPIGGVYGRTPAAAPGSVRGPLEHPVIVELARKHAKTPAQIVLRWHLEHGVSAIPKSVHADRIAGNFAIFDFQLSPPEVAAVDALDTGRRAGTDPERVDANTYPVRIPE